MSARRSRGRHGARRRRGAAVTRGNGPPQAADVPNRTGKLSAFSIHATTPTVIVSSLVALAAIAVIGFVIFGFPGGAAAGTTGALLTPDQPPLEYIYLDAARVGNYLGQVEDGLPKNELRTAQSTRDISASVSGGSVAQVGASLSQQEGTQDTVTPTAADEFYLLLRLLRQQQGSRCLGAASQGNMCIKQSRNCGPAGAHPHWLTDIADTKGMGPLDEMGCLGVGYFVRLTGVQLFLPTFSQVLPNAQSATALYGADPWPRTAFTSSTQSARAAQLGSYRGAVLRAAHGAPRMPFIAAPYGGVGRIGDSSEGSVPIFMPADYSGLTAEPSLLTGSVTVVGKIVYYATAGGSYTDFPTISQFVPELVGVRRHGFDNQLGVCDTKPPGAALHTSVTETEPTVRTQLLAARIAPKRATTGARSQTKSGSPPRSKTTSRSTTPPRPPTVSKRTVQRAATKAFAPNTCSTDAAIRKAIKAAVTLKPPFAIVLPLAIYQ